MTSQPCPKCLRETFHYEGKCYECTEIPNQPFRDDLYGDNKRVGESQR